METGIVITPKIIMKYLAIFWICCGVLIFSLILYHMEVKVFEKLFLGMILLFGVLIYIFFVSPILYLSQRLEIYITLEYVKLTKWREFREIPIDSLTGWYYADYSIYLIFKDSGSLRVKKSEYAYLRYLDGFLSQYFPHLEISKY